MRLIHGLRIGTPLIAVALGAAVIVSGGVVAVGQLQRTAGPGVAAVSVPVARSANATVNGPDALAASPPGSTIAGSTSAGSTTAAGPAAGTSATAGAPVAPTGSARTALGAPAPQAATEPTRVQTQQAPSTQAAATPTTLLAPGHFAANAPSEPRLGGVPGPANTGVPAGTRLTVFSGDLTVSTPGQVVDGLDIKGALTIRASNVVVRRSLIEGRSGRTSVVVASGTGIVFQDDEVAVVSPSPASDSMQVGNSTLSRLNIHGGVDGIKLGGNSTVSASWIHGLAAFASDPAQGGRATHNDAIQILSGTNILVTGNNLQTTSHNNAAIQVTQDNGTVSGLVVSSNWADGGDCTFNFSGHGPGGVLRAMGGITVVGNRFGRGSLFGCPVLTDLQTTIVQSGNVYRDSGALIAVQRHN